MTCQKMTSFQTIFLIWEPSVKYEQLWYHNDVLSSI